MYLKVFINKSALIIKPENQLQIPTSFYLPHKTTDVIKASLFCTKALCVLLSGLC